MTSSTAPPVSQGPTMYTLSKILTRLGLERYLDTLVENGFSTWETVLDITEEDLTRLNFKLGHRRTLQREIATYRGLPPTYSLEGDITLNSISSASASVQEALSSQDGDPSGREKRRYRRHPRPDQNAPKKPKTAYVNFADHLRTDPIIASLSFVDIAKEVGRRWQNLPAEDKRIWESQAARATQEYEAQMDEYKKTDLYRQYQVYLGEFKVQQAQPKHSKHTVSASGPGVQRQASMESRSVSDSPVPVGSSVGTEAELCHNALTLAFSELVSLRGEIVSKSIQLYNEKNLPPEDLTRRAMYAFIRGTGSFLYIWTYSQADEILDRIYQSEKAVDSVTLAECFIVAGMGAYYDDDDDDDDDAFTDHIRNALYASGTLQFDEKSARVDYPRTMRLLLSMSFYALLKKHTSARYLVAAGLQVARWKCPTQQQSLLRNDTEGWRKVYRSLVFMDCWLSYTLGYISDVSARDIAYACAPYADSTTLEEAIHALTSKIGLISAEIARAMVSPDLTTRETITPLKRKLETWRNEVPDMLQISTLMVSDTPHLTLYQRRSMLLVHTLYFSALMLLYRPLLLAAAEAQFSADGNTRSPDFLFDEVRNFKSECFDAAQQVAQVLSLISFGGTLTKRCWMIIHSAFSASIVLLFHAMTVLLEGSPKAADEDLKYTSGCLEILEKCSSEEAVAATYFRMLRPLYEFIRDTHQRSMAKVKASIFSLVLPTDDTPLSPPVPVTKEEMRPIAGELCSLITDPFGRAQIVRDGMTRRILNEDGSRTVFWWR
ncbi:hypothetical protein GQ43DRAFT_383250 [Delitschia confertaspora ATCC 74209]|uniref:HMG box domain-containing protein n=1 Tax=Delitschia confertaspora ATCC 74209 TaxID=1513339 RepID=A0A9P4JGW3_9PLEO|nr:hypothetical protein GQ43DRAFT_383250 [Delitschia confertaspora ATCC 74209]